MENQMSPHLNHSVAGRVFIETLSKGFWFMPLAAFPVLFVCTFFKISAGKGTSILPQMQFITIICPYSIHLSIFQNILRKGLLLRP